MGRVDDCVAHRRDAEVIFTTFGDAMRVPGSRKSLLQAKADGADVRMVYSPMDALALAREQSRSRGGVLRPRLRDDDAVDRADHAAGAKPTASKIFRCSATTSPSSRRSRRSSTCPDLQLDGFLGPGHVSMVIGTRPMSSSPSDYRKPMVVAGFEPLDVLQSIWMVLQADRAKAAPRSKINMRRVVPDERQRAGARARSPRVYRTARILRMARPRLDRSFRACGCATAYARFDAERKFAVPNVEGRRSAVLPVRRSAEGRHQAAAVQGVRHGLHAGNAARRADGVVGRRLRRLLSIWRPGDARGAAGGMTTSDPLDRAPKPRSAKDPCADGDARAWRRRQGDARPDRRRVRLAPSTTRCWRRWRTRRGLDLARSRAPRRPAGVHHRFLRGRSAVFPGRRHRQARRLRHRQRSRRRRREAALSLLLRRSSRRASTWRSCAASRARWRETAARGRRRDRHRRHQGRRRAALATSCSSPRPASASSARASSLGAHRASRATSCSSTALLGDHGAAILGARGDLALDSRRSRATARRCNGLIDGAAGAAPGGQLPARRDARRPRHGAQRDRRRLAASASRSTRRATPLREEVKGFCEILGLDPLYLANEGKHRRRRAGRRGARRRWRRMRAHPLGARRGNHRAR